MRTAELRMKEETAIAEKRKKYGKSINCYNSGFEPKYY